MGVALRQGDQALLIDGVAVTTSAAELNKLGGAGAAVASGTQVAAITDPTGGATIDAEARATIVLLIAALEEFGISASV